MANYSNLTANSYYLIREVENGEIMLVQPLLETGKCMLILHIDELESTFWRKKEDTIFDLVEELTAEQVEEYENLFEDDDEDSAWAYEEADFDFDEDDEDEDEKAKS